MINQYETQYQYNTNNVMKQKGVKVENHEKHMRIKLYFGCAKTQKSGTTKGVEVLQTSFEKKQNTEPEIHKFCLLIRSGTGLVEFRAAVLPKLP